MAVGTTIMQLRSRAGLTQDELANRLDPPSEPMTPKAAANDDHCFPSLVGL